MSRGYAEGLTAVVYRCFDEDDVLLYVGATTNLNERMAQHLTQAAWSHRVERVETTQHQSLDEARKVESRTIFDLRPRWNIHGRGGRFAWTLVDYVEVAMATAARADQSWNPENSAKKVQRLFREMRRRFPDLADVVIADIAPYCTIGVAA